MRNLLAVGRRGTKALVLATVLVCCYLEVYTPPEALAASTSDNFARADGPLGPNWTDMTDGGLTIASQVVEGGNSSNTGDMWTAETFGSDQFSEVQTTATPLTGDEWIGPSVRSQDGGASDYVGIYYWNSGSPVLMLFLRLSDAWEQLGATYNSGVLAAGTTLEVMATGTTITFLEDGVPCITASDSSLTGGAPGIMAYGTGEAADWSGGDVEVGALQSIGGTISGLSGTVVLADNSSDQLSLSANGPFTFASQVPSGSQYQVTVQTNPTGQTCSVANGAGTVGTTGVTDVTVSCVTEGNGSATDNFDRANGPLGPDWTDATEGGLAVSSDEVVGTNANGTSGDIRTAENYNSNQYSEIQVTSTQLSGTEWIGASVRVQDGGQEGYVGIYYWNNGSPELEVFNRTGSTWDQIGPAFNCGPLPAGTTLKLMVVGSTLSFLENGVERSAGYDPTYTGGDPGIMVYGDGEVGTWSGGTAGFEVHYLSTDANGVESYDMISANNGYGPQVLRVLNPTDPAAGVPHNFIYTLPVQPGADNTTYGDGLDTLESLNAQNQYNLTIVEPSFGIDPWYADNPLDANEQEETFMTTELVPWVMANLSTTGTEQNWLIGFSKSGYGGMDLLLKHPNLFALGAFWDFPADMSSYDELGSDPAASYGTDANFQANYRLTQAFVDARKAPFLSSNRIWLGGYSLYETDVTDFDALLTAEGIPHTLGPMQDVVHAWTSGWVPAALTALSQDSAAMGTGGLSPQAISFTAPSSGTPGGSATLNASGGASGNPVVFSVGPSSGTGVCTVSGTNGTTVNYAAAGTCVIDANQAGNATYAAAKQVQGTIAVVAVNQAPAITSAASAAATVGTAFTFAVQATGSPTPTLARTGTLPAGVSFKANSNGTATFSGTPTKSGSYTETITASNGVSPNATQSLVIAVDQAPAITSAASATATVGTAFSFSVKTSGYPTPSISDNGATLPAGLSFTDDGNGTATISGTPSASSGGLYDLAITASNGVGQPATQSFALTVHQAPAITSAASAVATVGTAFTFTVQATGYPTPTLARTGTLPAGVSFKANSNGTATFSGTPTKSGSHTETITASNGVSPKATQSLVITVG
ncbi:MAG: putative Ig domain-containing protein [Acidimicrobiales bacterium]